MIALTIREFLFGPAPTITPSDAARALGAVKRNADRAARDAMTARLAAYAKAGGNAGLGWRA